MDMKELARLKELAEKATQGKWVKQEAEKEENLANMRKIWGQS